MNNKGQALIVFILLLPIIVLLLAITADLGALGLSKQKQQNEIKSTIKYGLKNIEDENIKSKMETMLEKNTKGQKNIQINDKIIIINIKDKHKSIFNNIFKKNYNIDTTYKGYIEDNQIKIIKE